MKFFNLIIKKNNTLLILWLACCLTLLLPFNIYLFLALCIMVCYQCVHINKLWDSISTLLIIFGLTYSFITTFYYKSSSYAVSLSSAIGPVSLYLLGKYFVYKLRNERAVIIVLFLTCLATAVLISYYTLSDFAMGRAIDIKRGFDNEEAGLSATLYGLNTSIYMAGLGFFILCYNKVDKFVSFGFLTLFILALLTTVHLINRSGLAVALITTLAMLSTVRAGKFIKSILLLSILVILALCFTDSNFIDDAVSNYIRRDIGEGSVDSGGGRFERWEDAIIKFMDYPLGWWQNNSTFNAYVHNRWLDIARVAGVIPFLLSVVFLIYTIKTQIKLFKYIRKSPVVLLSFGMLVSFTIGSFVEPVFEANVAFFCFFDFLVGIETQLYNSRRILFSTKTSNVKRELYHIHSNKITNRRINA